MPLEAVLGSNPMPADTLTVELNEGIGRVTDGVQQRMSGNPICFTA